MLSYKKTVVFIFNTKIIYNVNSREFSNYRKTKKRNLPVMVTVVTTLL